MLIFRLPLLLFASITFQVYGQSDCVLKKNVDSIRVYVCKTSKPGIKSIQANLDLKIGLSALCSVLMDVEGYTAWQFNTIKAKVVQRISDHEMIYYLEVDAPWPVSNRDLVVRFTINQNPETREVTITANSQPEYIPKNEGLVRVPSSTSSWRIIPKEVGLVAVDYSIEIDPGGAVPMWMANMVAAEAPLQSFQQLKKIIQHRAGTGATVDFIKD